MQLPGLQSLILKSKRVLVHNRVGMTVVGEMVVVDASVVDSGAVADGLPRNTILRPGFVLGKNNANGRYYDAANALVTGSTPATVTSKIAIGAGASGKIFKFALAGAPSAKPVSITMTGVTTTDAAVTALMASIPFAANLVAENVGGLLALTTLRCGRQARLRVLDGNFNGQGGTGDDTFTSSTDAGGATDGDYRVLGLGGGGFEDYLDMNVPLGVAASQGAANLWRGEFRLNSLIGATEDALAVLSARGSTLV